MTISEKPIVICESNVRAGAQSAQYPEDVLLAWTVAHELGHAFSLKHYSKLVELGEPLDTSEESQAKIDKYHQINLAPDTFVVRVDCYNTPIQIPVPIEDLAWGVGALNSLSQASIAATLLSPSPPNIPTSCTQRSRANALLSSSPEAGSEIKIWTHPGHELMQARFIGVVDVRSIAGISFQSSPRNDVSHITVKRIAN